MSVAAIQPNAWGIDEFGREARKVALVAIAYYLAAQAAFFIGTLSDKIFAPFWPPNIVLLCALLLTPARRWWLPILAAFPAHALAEHGVGMPLLQMLAAFATNCAFAIIAALALRRALGGPPWFDTLRKAWLYVLLAAIACPMVAALGGGFMRILGDGAIEKYPLFWADWFMSNALGSMTLGPIALMALSARRWSLASIPKHAFVEATFLGVALIAVCTVVFEASVGNTASGFLPALLYLPLPLVLWAAVRFGVKGASGAILVVTIVLIWKALNGPSIFLASDSETSVFAIQAFLIGLAIPVLLLGASIDETRHAERAVRESEERMKAAAVAANISMWHFNYESESFWLTDHGREMFGFAPDETVTRYAVMSRVHPEDRQAAIDAMQAATAAGKLAVCEFRIVWPDGQVRWILCRAGVHGDYRGAPAQISGTFVDISERKAAESEVAHQRHELAHLMRVSMLGELSGGIAHELTQPLSAILSNAEAARILLTQKNPNIAEVVEVLDDIIGEDNRAGEVIRRLRGLLKKSEAKFESVDLNDLVTSTLRLLHNEQINRRVRVFVDLTSDIPLVSGDPVQLQQVLLNLLLNAMDAMNEMVPSRRKITVSTRLLSGEEIEVSVADSGIGLSQSSQMRAFQPFFTTKERGLGLGLSLSSSIIKLHLGDLILENNAQGGATARFRLPRLNTMMVAAK